MIVYRGKIGVAPIEENAKDIGESGQEGFRGK